MSVLLAAVGRIGGFLAALAAIALVGVSPGAAQAQSRSWLDPTLLEAAKREGSVVIYTSTNEREGLPLFKIFEDATGIKVHYIRAGDGMLVSRSLIEVRAGQASFDAIFSHAAHKLPQTMLAQYEPSRSEASQSDGARSGPALVWRLRQLQHPGLQHQDDQRCGIAEDL